MALEILFVAVLPAIFIAAGAWDLTSFTIPNIFPLALLVLFLVFAAASPFLPHGISANELAWHGAAGGLGLAIGIGMFALGWIGGGDAKLFAMACLWLGWDQLLAYGVFASLFGGGLTLSILILRAVPLPAGIFAHEWLVRLTDKKSGIPYGVALSAAALATLPATDLFRHAALS